MSIHFSIVQYDDLCVVCGVGNIIVFNAWTDSCMLQTNIVGVHERTQNGRGPP